MESVVLVIHLILALAIIALVLLQRSEGGGLGIGGGGGGMGGLASARGTANALTKLTGICAAGFFITSLTLGYIASHKHNDTTGILESVNEAEIQAPIVDDLVAPDAGITYIPPTETEIPEINVEDITNKAVEAAEPVKDAVMPEVIAPIEIPQDEKPSE
ncbi:MAG: preprotein translocase subunit SecG [Alphaproteobacteria bacterium]